MEFTRATVGRAVRSFHPASMPRMSRGHYRRELAAWSLLPVAMGAIEGGMAGVIAKYLFAGVVSTEALNMVVAVLASVNALANIMSFVWAAASHGRHKIRATVLLQLGTVTMIAMCGFVPFSALGLYLFVAGVIGARVCWSGVIILRSTVWHANYPRSARATMAGKLATIQAVIMALVAFGIGEAAEFNREAIRLAYPAAAIVGSIGVFIYAGMRMRGHQALLAAERKGEDATASSFNPLKWRHVLREDTKYRLYQTCMFIFGMGNLMVQAPLVIMLKDHFQVQREGTAAIIIASIPLLLMPVTIPFWSRLLDRMHIIRYRAIHCWAFVSSIVIVLIAAVTVQLWLVFIASILKGVAVGGGVLGWNLGHHDFAPPERVSQYMGVHVTLTGIRGIAGPIFAVSVYQALQWWRPGAGAWVFAIALALSLTGAIGFVRLAIKTGER